MLVGLIGAPTTGKTTLAAGLFAKLKEMGIACEFVPEAARRYIASKKLASDGGIHLTDIDQEYICSNQVTEENLFVDSGTRVVVSDGSSVNAYFYMDQMAAVSPKELSNAVAAAIMRYDILFFARHFDVALNQAWDPVCAMQKPSEPDPNRVHGEKFSLRMDNRIEKILSSLSTTNVFQLSGGPAGRLNQAINTITLRLEAFRP